MRLIIAVIFLTAGVAVLAFWGRVLWADIQTLEVETKSYETALTRLNSFRKTRDDLLASYNAIPSSDLRRIKNFLPANVNSGALLVQLSNMADSSELFLRNISIFPLDERTNEAKISLAVSGSYDNFFKFLSDLERSLRLIEVSQLSFSPNNQDEPYSFTLEAVIFTQK